MRICRVVTIPFFVSHHLRTQLEATIAAGHDVHVVCSDGPELAAVQQIKGLKVHTIEIRRRVAPIHDLGALVKLYLHFRQVRYDIVHSVTPKAGLLAMLAAAIARIRVRLHNFSGQAWLSQEGWLRTVARLSDRLVVTLATQCYSDSESQRAFLEAEGLAPRGAIRVLGAGSIAGVDLRRFDARRFASSRLALRRRLRIPDGAKVITFVGRVTRDKGIEELVAAFALVRDRIDAYLVVVGPEETHIEPLRHELRETLRSHPAIRWLGYFPEPEQYVAIADVFCLPSYRESFGIVLLEAAALGVPVVATRIVGVVDAVLDGETGLLVPARDADMLGSALLEVLTNDSLREKLGAQAQQRAVANFSSEVINQLVLNEYARYSQTR